MAIIDIMEIGRQGLVAQRQAMQTTSNNIANANTPGYNRQRAQMTANAQSMSGSARIGGGVDVKGVIRVHDSFIQNQILDESKNYGAYKTSSDSLRQVEGILSNDAFRVGDLVNKFFGDVRDLSASPEEGALRANVAHSADATASGFRKISESLTALKTDIDGRLESACGEINVKTRELAELNGQISHLEARREEPNELYDRRDMIVRDLAQKLGLQITTNDQGHVNLVAEGTGVLVQGTDANQLIVMNTPADGKKMSGSADLFIKDAFGLRSITNGLRGGELGGLLHVRDEIINPALRHLDHVAYEFANRVNDIHKEGVGSDGETGRAMFNELGDVAGAASRLSISDDVKNNVGAIAAGFSGAARGDNRAMLAIAELQSQSLLPGAPPENGETSEGARVQTFNESLNTLVGKIGTEVAHEDALFKHQEAVINQLDNYRQSVSGVSLEEEAVNMMQYQTVFNASAKAMKIGDELFQTILSIKE